MSIFRFSLCFIFLGTGHLIKYLVRIEGKANYELQLDARIGNERVKFMSYGIQNRKQQYKKRNSRRERDKYCTFST